MDSKSWKRILAFNTALHVAVQHESAPVVSRLLDHGARADCFNGNGRTPLHQAAEKGHLAIVTKILQATHVVMHRSRCESGWTALHIAARRGFESIVHEIVKTALHRGEEFLTEDTNGYTPFQHAKAGAHSQIAKYLFGFLKQKKDSYPSLDSVNADESGFQYDTLWFGFDLMQCRLYFKRF